MAHKAAVLLLLLTIKCSAVPSTVVGNIATIQRYNGDHLGPYIIKDFHSHEPDTPSAVALPLTGDEEGSGYYSALFGDAEDGDDTGSGLMGIASLFNDYPLMVESPDPRPIEKNLDLEPANESPKTSESKSDPAPDAVSEWMFDSDPITTQTPSPSTTQQPTEPSTPARPSSPPLPQATTEPQECHESCVSLLEGVTLEMLPEEVSFLREGEGMRMVCSVSATKPEQEELLEQIQLNWLFQGETPPVSECSLDGQHYLAACEGFASVWEEQQRNSTHLKADILFTKMAQRNTGRYMCQAAAHCCGSLPKRQLQHGVIVWRADYTTELIVMSTTALLLTALVIATLIWKKRAADRSKTDYMKVLVVSSSDLPSSGKVLHLPLQQDDDFDDRDSFSSTDSAAYP